LKGDGQHALQLREMLGRLARCEAREAMERGEPGVTRRDAGAPGALEIGEKGRHVLEGEIGEVERLGSAVGVAPEEPQVKEDRVAVAVDRVDTHAAQRRQVVLKILDENAPERVRCRGHRTPPWATCPK
jgi:hypothetical protein